MSKLEAYNIALKELTNGTHTFEYELDNTFFEAVGGTEVQKGNLKAEVRISVHATSFDVSLNTEGSIFITCDRCLDDMEQPISGHEKLQVKFGNTYNDDGDVVVVPETDGTLNVAWFLYETIVLAIPIQHMHPQGHCNKAMESTLKSHLASEQSETDTANKQTDPRWDSLKNILKNN